MLISLLCKSADTMENASQVELLLGDLRVRPPVARRSFPCQSEAHCRSAVFSANISARKPPKFGCVRHVALARFVRNCSLLIGVST